MFRNLLLIPIIFAASLASAQKKKIDIFAVKTMTTAPDEVEVKETVFEINGERFRQTEYKGEIFYAKFLDLEAQSLEALCDKKLRVNLEPQSRVVISTRITKRSSLYIQTLKTSCLVKPGQFKAVIEHDMGPEIGVDIKGEKRDHKIFVNPTKGVGYGTSF